MYFSQQEHPSPPFTDDTIQYFREQLIEFFVQHGVHLDWTIRDHQPMHLLVLQQFSELMQDRDRSLFASLIDGVATGFHHDIPPSECMPPNDREADLDVPLSAHYSNWNSAESDVELTRLFKKKSTRVGFSNFMGLLKRHKSSGQAAYHWAN